MKRILTAAVMTAALCSTATQASAIRVDGGKVMISTGDSAGKLRQHLGSPNWREVAKVCKKPSSSPCSGNRAGWGHLMQYSTEKRNWTVEVFDGVITRIEWAR